MVEHLQSGDQAIAPEDSAWQAMPHFSETGCTSMKIHTTIENITSPSRQIM